MAIRFKPLADRLLIQPSEAETATKGGIIIPDTTKEKPQEGKVIAIGNGKYDGKDIRKLEVKVGDKVMYGKYAGTNIKLDGTEYVVIREEDVMGIIE